MTVIVDGETWGEAVAPPVTDNALTVSRYISFARKELIGLPGRRFLDSIVTAQFCLEHGVINVITSAAE